MVTNSSTIQYMSRMGQKTGTSKMGKNVIRNPIKTALNEEYLQRQQAASVQRVAKYAADPEWETSCSCLR